jgi:hypothetical protein
MFAGNTCLCHKADIHADSEPVPAKVYRLDLD